MVKDIVNQLQMIVGMASAAIGTDTTTTGDAIDTAHYEEGLMFSLNVSAYTDGTFVIRAQESDDGSTGWTSVDEENYCNTPASATAATGSDAMTKLGVFSTKRYVRSAIVSTSTTSGATMEVLVTQKAELKPTPVS